MKDLAKEGKFKLIIVCFPVSYQVEAEFLENEPQQRLASIAQEGEIPFLDLLPAMRGAENKQKLYFDNCHLTYEGHEFVANKIEQFLKGIL